MQLFFDVSARKVVTMARGAAVLALCASIVSAHRLELHRVEDRVQIKRDFESGGRLRSLESGKFEAIPLNLGLGTHFTWVYAGTPPQRASVIVDTGSHLMAFPCAGCDGCGKHTDPPFDVSKSSTLVYPTCSSKPPFACGNCGAKDQCSISQSYTEGSSWQAVVVEDFVWLGDAVDHPVRHFNESYSTRFMFGCQTHETGLFVSQVADGILGVANGKTNLVRKLYEEKKIESNSFALCFTAHGGTMAIGTLSTSHHEGDLQFAAATSMQNGWYGVTVTEIRFGSKILPVDLSHANSGHHVIVDSGTTDSYLPSAFADAWASLFLSVTGKQYESSNCAGYSEEEIAKMPPLEIEMLSATSGQHVVFSVPASQIFSPDGKHCGGLFFTEASGGVIGANFMINHDFVFDPDQKRVGFVPAKCEYRGIDNEMPEHASEAKDKPSSAPEAATTAAPAQTTTEAPKTTTTSAPQEHNATATTAAPASTASSPVKAATTNESSNFGASITANVSNEFIAVVVLCAVVVLALVAYRKWWRKDRPKTQWTKVSTVQVDEEERVPLGEEPMSLRGNEDESDDDEFFDSEGYVMSPRSIKKTREAFDL
ncbi:unnamed protein product [Aphanomyces euteiches]